MNLVPLVVPLSAPAIVLLARPLVRYVVLLAGLVITMRGIEGDARVRAYAALARAMAPHRDEAADD